MIKFTVKGNFKKVEFGVKNIKYFLGPNQIIKYDVIKTIKKHFKKVDDSEYALENNQNQYLYIDDKSPNLRKWFCYEINHNFNLEHDLKLGSKSMVLKMFSGLFQDIEYNDNINTIDTLFKDLLVELNESLEEIFPQYNIALTNEQFNFKNIFKLIIANAQYEELKINQYDMCYNQYLLIQLQILTTIAEKHPDFDFLGLVEIPIITGEITEKLENINLSNLKIIINSTDNHSKITSLDDVVYFNNQIVDLSDDVAIYNDIMLNLDQQYSLEEIQINLFDYITKNDKKSNLNFKNIL